MLDGDEPTYESDLRRVRNYHVVTTAGEVELPLDILAVLCILIILFIHNQHYHG